MPNVVVIAGPNGAGKTTLAPHLLRDRLGIFEYVNADTIAQGLSAFALETVAIEAARIMLRRLRELAEQRKDFAFETTLATRSYLKWLSSLRFEGFYVHLVFLWLSSPELAIERVSQRVRRGGHDIPEATIRRRYERGLGNLVRLYLPIVDSWEVLDVSQEPSIEVAFGDKTNGKVVINEGIWQMIEK